MGLLNLTGLPILEGGSFGGFAAGDATIFGDAMYHPSLHVLSDTRPLVNPTMIIMPLCM
jgi:hypothetical protein